MNNKVRYYIMVVVLLLIPFVFLSQLGFTFVDISIALLLVWLLVIIDILPYIKH